MGKRKDLSDSLALSMDQVLNSEDHIKIFSKSIKEPKVVTASVKEHPAKQVFDLLVNASEELDYLGLSASAARTLQAAEKILSEMYDTNEVMDLPSEYDMDEGVVDEGETLINLDDPDYGIAEGHPTDENGDIIDINHHNPISFNSTDSEQELVRVGPNHWLPRNELDPKFLSVLDEGADLNQRLDLDPDQLSEEDLRTDEEYVSPESKILDNMITNRIDED